MRAAQQDKPGQAPTKPDAQAADQLHVSAATTADHPQDKQQSEAQQKTEGSIAETWQTVEDTLVNNSQAKDRQSQLIRDPLNADIPDCCRDRVGTDAENEDDELRSDFRHVDLQLSR